MEEEKKYLDYEGLQEYDRNIKELITENEKITSSALNDLNNRIGTGSNQNEVEIGRTTPSDPNVKIFIDENEDPAVSLDVYTRAQTNTLLADKVDKVTGKGLSTNDFTDEDKEKLDDIPSWAMESTKPSYTLDDISDGSSRKLANYLPLSGGTITAPKVKIEMSGPAINVKTLSDTKIASIGSGTGNPMSGYELGILQLFHNGVENARLYSLPSDNSWVCYGSKNFGVGTDSPSYKLHVNGAVGATGYNNTSDIRKKDIIENLNLNVEDIANAPLFKFSWLDPEMPEGVNIGTSAQYWQTIIPELVSAANDDEKTLSMQYGVAGLASSIALARKVVEQEKTIKAQEARIKALEDAIAEIQNKLK